MEYRQLGRSGLRVSSLAFGTNTFGGTGIFRTLGCTDLPAATRLIDRCLDAGVTLFDTADEYSGGIAEEILGTVLARRDRRDRALLATKVGTSTGDGPNDAGLSRHHLIRACEASLRRLKTDHIDLYQLHTWDGKTPLEEIVGALDTLVRSGKVRYVGACNFSAWHLMKATSAARAHGLPAIVSHQIHYTLQAREAEYELVPMALDQGVGLLVWSPLAGGLLTAKYLAARVAPPESRRLAGWDEPPIRDRHALEALLSLLVEIGNDHGVPPACVALSWVLARPGITSLILGARTEQQLSENLTASQVTLSADERGRLDDLTRPPLIYPYWHQAKLVGDRLSPADTPLLGHHSA